MLFFYSPYVIQTSSIDNICYKTVFFFVVCAGIILRILAVTRADMFLTSLKLIEDIDIHLRNRGISVDCKSCRFIFLLYASIPFGCVVVFICYYFSDTTSEEDNIYEIVHMTFSFAISYVTIASQVFYLGMVAIILTDRMQHLSYYLDKLNTLENTKIIEQEVITVSQLHLKVCQSWNFSLKAHGLSMVCIMLMVYAYSLVAFSVVMGFIIPKLSKISFLPALTLLTTMPYIVMVFQKLQNSADEFKSHVVQLCLARNAERNVNLTCRTLLLQIEHVDIDLLVFGIMRLDPQSYLEGLKSMSTIIMFLVQIKNT
ncbi:uncharacterized protein LOC123678167 [Harmonia axyridis]|uniref:uncharacterized protein LOC123678167 n=1 Tax=Harmonia axyridis TaxID=115357 RepID=UPI001E275787|nr:uncharacterized protein LOC123678167 [Harmonia axyridis]